VYICRRCGIIDTSNKTAGQKATEKEVKTMEGIITKIEKSYKFEGYCFITRRFSNGKVYTYKRKCYTRKTGTLAGKQLFNLDTMVYSFEWDKEDDTKGTNLQLLGSYKDINLEDDDEEVEPEDNEEPAQEIKVPDGEVFHEKFGMIKACISANIPVYLAGPAGSGKNHTLEQVAEQLGLDFYFTNSVQQEYKLTGFIDAGGKYHETEFYKAFTNGGIFFLDEMDASIPEVLVLLNAAIANRYFEFPNGKVTAHEDFRVVAAGNTVGSGADEQYTGRLVLDQATLDRFAIIEFDYSLAIEAKLAKGDMVLVNFIHSLRKFAQENGIRATFSYRAITMIVKLKDNMDLVDILKIAVFKGMDKDTIKTFRLYGSDKYNEAFKKLAI
jgi:hypothetical protein